MSEFLGKTIGEYQLIETIDEGGAALVYKGFQPNMNRYVAIKVLKPHAARDAAGAQRFRQAAELTAQMQHPNILPVYDIGQSESTIYRVSAFAEGGTLHANLASFQNTAQAVELMKQLTAALEYIHGRGYVHGNLKSSNVLLDVQRRPLISDFGLTQLAGGAPNPYMSPEQVQGGVVDRRSDVYAQGVLLYEMLVGETPPPGVVVSLRARRPDLPEAIERVVLKAMAQNPDQRFQSSAEFQTALERAVAAPVQPPAPAPAPAAAPTPSVSQSVQVEQSKGTNWVAIALGALLIGVLCVAAAVLIVPRLQEDEGALPTQPPVEVTAEIPTEAPPVEQPTAPPEQPTEPPPPEQPTEPPPVEQPTAPPEQPTEPPPPEQPTEPPPEQPTEEAPEQLPEDPDDSGGGLPDLCGSTALAGGMVILGGVMATRRRRMRLN